MSLSTVQKSILSGLFCCFAAPLAAQDLCGGVGTGGQWIGGSEAASDISAASSVQEQMALVLGGNEYVALFSVSGPTQIRVEAQGRGAADPQLDLYDAEGGIIASDDDSGGGGAARAEVPLDAGTYCVAVRSYDGAPMTSFVRITRADQEPLTAGLATETSDPDTSDPANPPDLLSNSSCDDAQVLSGALDGDGLTGTASVNENGFWQFTLDAEAAITIKAENEEADPVISLFDANSDMIDQNDDYDGLNAQIDAQTPLAAGSYCVQVTAVNDNDMPITTTVVPYDPTAVIQDQINSGDTAPPLDGSVEITNLGTLETRMRQDVTTTPNMQWYQINMDAPGLMLIEAVAPGGNVDPWLVAFDDLGRKVGQNDDYGEGYDSLIAAKVPAGSYLIGIKQLEESGTGNVRMVLERYIAAN